MATVVYLDIDDEITSAASRIRVADESRVALVVPYGSRLATSRINFRLLAREAQARGRRLSVVAGDAATRALAASAGLPVFGSVGEYEDAEADRGSGDGPTAAGVAAAGATAANRRAGARGDPIDPTEATIVAPVVTGGTTTSARPAGTERGARDLSPPTGRTVVPASPAAAAAVGGASAGRTLRWPFSRTAGVAAVAALALLVLAAGVGAYLLLPSAEVTLTLRREVIGPISLEIRADPSVTAPDPAAAVVPAQRLTFDVAVSDTFPSTGKRIEATPATGSVVFSSLDTGGSNTIPAGAIVSTEGGIQFRTAAAVTLPPAQLILGDPIRIEPATRRVDVTAVEDGAAGNVPANAIRVVPRGEDPELTKVNNAAPTGGGTSEEFPQITQGDVDAALAELNGRLALEFERILGDPNQVPDDLTLFPSTRVLEASLPTTDPTTLVGQELAEFPLGVATTGSVIAVDEAPVATVAQTLIEQRVDDGFELVDGSVQVTPGNPTVIGEQISFPVDASAEQLRVIDVASLEDAIQGQPVERARELLEPYGTVSIDVWPDWVSAIPTADSRVELRVQAPAPGDAPSISPGATDRPVESPPTDAPGTAGSSAGPASSPEASADPGLEGETPP